MTDYSDVFRKPIRGASVVVGDDPESKMKNIIILFDDDGVERVVICIAPMDTMLLSLATPEELRRVIADTETLYPGASEFAAVIEAEMKRRQKQ